MQFRDDRPIYLQIEHYLDRQIILGHFVVGQRLPSVRKLALKLAVNVNTVQHALQEMERKGLVFTSRGKGSFVTKDERLLVKVKQEMFNQELANFVKKMRNLGVNDHALLSLLTEFLKKEEK